MDRPITKSSHLSSSIDSELHVFRAEFVPNVGELAARPRLNQPKLPRPEDYSGDSEAADDGEFA